MSTVTKTFDPEFLKEEVGIGWGGEGVVLHEPVDKHRWYTSTRVIFKHEDQLWEVYYMDPATEMQEGQDWFYENPVRCRLVEAYEKTITEYRPVEQ